MIPSFLARRLVLAAGGALLLALAPRLSAQCYVQSTFDTDTEGWTHIGASIFQQNASGGNPGGFLYIDNSEGPVTYIFAPAKFRGDLRAFDGGTVSFDGNMLGIGGIPWTSAGQDYGHLRISNGGTSATADLLPAPGQPLQNTWSTYSLPFTAAVFGVSQATWTNILSNVTEVRLSVEAMFGGEIQGIDNVKLVASKPPSSTVCNGTGVNPLNLTNTSATAPAPVPSTNAPVLGKNWLVELDCGPAGTIGGLAIFRIGFTAKPAPISSKWGEILVPITAGTGQNFVVAVPGNRRPVLGPILLPNDPALLCVAYAVQGFCPASPVGYLGNALAEMVGN